MSRKSLALVLLAVALNTSVWAGEIPAILEAHHAYYNEQYARSLALYEQLSASGNAEAAERAGFMLLLGEELFGPQIKRDPRRAKVLLVQAAKAGRTGAGFMLNMIESTD